MAILPLCILTAPSFDIMCKPNEKELHPAGHQVRCKPGQVPAYSYIPGEIREYPGIANVRPE